MHDHDWSAITGMSACPWSGEIKELCDICSNYLRVIFLCTCGI